MKAPRVRRSAGPKSAMTKATYRKKALPFLMKDFEGKCAYCLDPGDFRHVNQSHVEHFNCRLKEREKNRYGNLMLACATCNLCKHDKPVINSFDAEQRLLNCTIETEFPEHIVEMPDGQWFPLTKAGEYHLASIGLKEDCHRRKRFARRSMAEQVLALCTTAIQYKSANPEELHNRVMEAIRATLSTLDAFPPLITENGVMTVRKWLESRGVDTTIFNRA